MLTILGIPCGFRLWEEGSEVVKTTSNKDERRNKVEGREIERRIFIYREKGRERKKESKYKEGRE